MPIDGIQPKAPNGPGDGVKRSPHVDGLDGNEDSHRRGEAQHERRASSTRRSVATETSSPNSNRAPAISRTYRVLLVVRAAAGTSGISSTREWRTGAAPATR